MTDKDFYTLFGAANEEQDKDRYIAEWSSSDIFYPDPEEEGPSFDEVAAILQNIWDVAHMTVKDIRETTGLTQAEYAIHFCISRRTIENWESNYRNCADYVRLMMAESLGLLDIKREMPVKEEKPHE